MRFLIVILVCASALFSQCGLQQLKSVKHPKSTSTPISHQLFDELLRAHVDQNGRVNYEAFASQRVKFEKYLKLMSEHYPNESWTYNQRKAYWINAYNAFTIKLILDNYPVKSIKDIKKGNVPFVNTVWDSSFIVIEGKALNLNNIEHGILRKEYFDARIHYAVNCASIGCPPLRNSAYTADQLEKQLEEQATYFLNSALWNQLDGNYAKLSMILKWYSSDFKKDDRSIIKHINKYAKEELKEDAEIEYNEYDWNLNEQ